LRWRRWRGPCLALALAGPAAGAPAAPAAFELDVESIATGPCRMEGPGAADQGGGSQSITASFLARRPLGGAGWYAGGGFQAEDYFFADNPAWPRRLQDYAAALALEYYRDGESVASLTAQPGFYFGTHAALSAWDVPFTLVSGVPVASDFAGVIGVSNGRFYHHALPIAGFVWTLGPRVRLEAVYPEPALVLTLDRATTLRLGGELTGEGFLVDAPAGRTVVEYSSYRVGLEWRRDWRPGVRLALGAGFEVERTFDYFRRQGRLQGTGNGYVKFSAEFSGN
jgi:hypothetical protein